MNSKTITTLAIYYDKKQIVIKNTKSFEHAQAYHPMQY